MEANINWSYFTVLGKRGIYANVKNEMKKIETK